MTPTDELFAAAQAAVDVLPGPLLRTRLRRDAPGLTPIHFAAKAGHAKGIEEGRRRELAELMDWLRDLVIPDPKLSAECLPGARFILAAFEEMANPSSSEPPSP